MRRRKETRGAASRWTAWARALAGRHGRRGERVDGLALELARPRALAKTVRQRWIVSSRLVEPRISLAIHPVLRASFWRGGVVEKVLESTRTTRTERTYTDEHFRATERLRESREHGIERLREVERVLSARPALQTVFARLREPGRLLDGRLVREERLAEAPALARSLAARVRREEKPLPGGTPARVLRESSVSSPEERRAPSSARGAEPGETPPRPLPGWGSPAAPGAFAVPTAPPINVEALTDQVMRQIDRRVGAWRERTGGF